MVHSSSNNQTILPKLYESQVEWPHSSPNKLSHSSSSDGMVEIYKLNDNLELNQQILKENKEDQVVNSNKLQMQ